MNKPDQETLDRLNVRIAELMGWKITQLSVHEPNDDVSVTPPGLELNPWRDANVEIPDFTGSLDAIHDVEHLLDSLGQPQGNRMYFSALHSLSSDGALHRTEAWQRAVAIDRCLSPHPIL